LESDFAWDWESEEELACWAERVLKKAVRKAGK